MKIELSFTLLVAVVIAGVVLALASLAHVPNPWREANSSLVTVSSPQL